MERSPSTRPSARRKGFPDRPVSPTHPGQDSRLLSAFALNAPLTFSHTTKLGLITDTASRTATQRFDLVPSDMPARAPATDTSWHGLPPAIMSTGSTEPQSIVVTSPRFGTSGNLWASTCEAYLSTSHNQLVSAPKTLDTASASPPYPAKSSPALGVVFIFMFRRGVISSTYRGLVPLKRGAVHMNMIHERQGWTVV